MSVAPLASLPQTEGLAGSFGWADWGVLLATLAFATWLGHRKSGKQTDLRGFFLGGRSLPWWAVAASIIATEISAVTYISLPSVVFKPGGNITYLQIGLFGSLVARAVVGYVLVPAYFEREIYSPYDYMGARLGGRTKGLTTGLFAFGGVLAQAARVYLTAVVLEIILFEELAAVQAATGVPPLAAAVIAIGVVAVAWTWMGGIATVIWTDALLFVLFLVGIAVSLVAIHNGLEGGLVPALQAGYDAGKFQLLDTSTDPTKAYTLMVALFVASWGQIGPYGCDQLMVQRLFACKDARAARWAILASIGAMALTAAVAVIGVGLWAWYQTHGMSPAGAALVADKADRIFPVFIREVLPTGAKGLVLAGAFAAAISSLDSILAALAQTTHSVFFSKGPRAEGPAALRTSRVLVLIFGVLLSTVAIGMEWVEQRYDSLLDLALAMAGYTQGALLAGFFLAFLPLKPRGTGLLFAAPFSVLAVVATAWHEPWTVWVVGLGGGALVLAYALSAGARRAAGSAHAFGIGSFAIAVTVATFVAYAGSLLAWGYRPWPGTVVAYFSSLPGGQSLPWPWYAPIGALVTLGLTFALDPGASKSPGTKEPQPE